MRGFFVIIRKTNKYLVFPLVSRGVDKYTGAMKSATHQAMFADRRVSTQFTHSAHHDRRDETAIILPMNAAMTRTKKRTTGGNDGGPPAGMVMPDMSIGSVPFYG